MGKSNVPAAYAGSWHQRFRWHLHSKRVPLREWLLEDSASKGLGGPPNNWQSVAAREMDNGIGHAEYGARFGDDATTVMLHVRYTDDPGDQGRWLAAIPVVVFRRFALWYLWRWAYGEWFGLRRRLFYRWLHRHVARMQARRG